MFQMESEGQESPVHQLKALRQEKIAPCSWEAQPFCAVQEEPMIYLENTMSQLAARQAELLHTGGSASLLLSGPSTDWTRPAT